MKIKAGPFTFLYILSVVLSLSLSLSVPLMSDELGALKNIYIPVIVAFATLVLLLLGYVIFRKRIFNRFVLIAVACINLLTGLYLKIAFKPFLEHAFPGQQQDYRFDLSRLPPNQHTCSDVICYQNTDGFPDDDHLIFSHVFVPPGSAKAAGEKPNLNHDEITVRVTNNGDKDFKIYKASFSDEGLWRISMANKEANATLFPLIVSPHQFVDIAITFTGERIQKRISNAGWKRLLKLQYTMIGIGKKINYQIPLASTAIDVNGFLKLTTNNTANPVKKLYLNSLWQYRTESDWEPDLQKQLNILGFSTRVNFRNFDKGVNGEKVMPSSDEIECSYFKIADPVLPVNIRKLAAYHGCCAIEDADELQYYYKGQRNVQVLLSYPQQSGQMLLPKPQNIATSVTQFYPLTAFGFKIGNSYTDRAKNYGKKIGIRIWKAIDGKGKIVPNTYLIGSDYLGTKGTNYDYQDNVYYVTNVIPEG